MITSNFTGVESIFGGINALIPRGTNPANRLLGARDTIPPGTRER